MSLGFLLPVCLGYLVFDILRRRKVATGVREILLIEALFAGVAIVVVTEFLNIFQALSSAIVIIVWSLVGVIAYKYRTRQPRAEPQKVIAYARDFLWGAAGDGRILLAVTTLLAFSLMLVALVATPNNYDSMTYHLARMAHWIQEHSIAFYGTNNVRQNFMPPLAEWTMLQLALLQGDDRVVNMVQWLSYCGCILGASIITELLGGTRRDGVIAAFFAATLPGAIFESTSTQNDLVMSFWLTCCVYGCIKLSLQPGWLASIIFGASLGLCLLTKSVTFIFATPLCLWASWALSRTGLKKALPQLAVIALLALSLNIGHAARNLASSGHLLGPKEHAPDGGSLYANDTFTTGAMFSNILRNLSLHMCLNHQKDTPEEAVIAIHRALGLDPQDPRTTFNGGTYSIWEGDEDGTPMFLHLLTALLASVVLIWNRRRFSFLPFALIASAFTGAILFCIILKWQPFHARLHLALFIMSAPLAGLALGSCFTRMFSLPILLLFITSALPHVYYYSRRPALGASNVFITSSDSQQLCWGPELVYPYPQLQHIFQYNKVHSVGLILKDDDWEYPLENTARAPAAWRTDHMLIQDAYSALETAEVPDVALCTRPGLPPNLMIHGQPFTLVQVWVNVDRHFVISLYIRQGLNFFLPRQKPAQVPATDPEHATDASPCKPSLMAITSGQIRLCYFNYT